MASQGKVEDISNDFIRRLRLVRSVSLLSWASLLIAICRRVQEYSLDIYWHIVNVNFSSVFKNILWCAEETIINKSSFGVLELVCNIGLDSTLAIA